MKLNSYLFMGLALAAFAACDESHNDWVQQEQNEQPATVTFGNDGAVTPVATINFASLPAEPTLDDSVKVCDITMPTSSYAEGDVTYVLILNDEEELEMNASGKVLYEPFKAYVEKKYGKDPTKVNVMTAKVVAYPGNKDTKVRQVISSGTFTVNATPTAPAIDFSGYYMVGSPDGWSCTRKEEYKLNNGGGTSYTDGDFKFSMILPNPGAGDVEMKFLPAQAFNDDGSIANWDIALACTSTDEDGMSGTFSWDNQGGNIKFTATEDAKMYKITLDLMDGKYTIEAMSFEEFIYMPGKGQKYLDKTEWGWNPGTAPALRSARFDGKYTGFAYLDSEFKFTKARNWDGGEYNYGSFNNYSDGFTGEGTGNINLNGEGFYYIEADVANSKFTATAVTFGLVGPATAGGWDAAQYSVMTYDKDNDAWTITTDLNADEFKFTTNGSWDINLGGTADDLDFGASNLRIEEAGNYTITLKASRTNSPKMFCTINKN